MDTTPFYRILTSAIVALVLVCGLSMLMIVLETQSRPTVEIASADTETLTPPDPALNGPGKALFRNNCGSCHAMDMKTNSVGPALGDARQNWSKYEPEDFYDWINSSQALIQKGHPYAVELYEKWNRAVMPNFPNLSKEEIDQIFEYVDAKKLIIRP